ncbi:hypothetical protein TIFTF001_041369 [Ficus carica]|uniref:Uncharacterized protein n=1 Tax=Ficus carica TaxID=3494 RepID=A0AA87Z6W7_FICCA|nr:hypothetical protein TIFTF001_041369 [Ficus carica]
MVTGKDTRVTGSSPRPKESNLQLYSEEEQHYVGHSERGMYAVLLQCYVIRCFAVCHVPSYDASYAKVSNLQAVADTIWRSMAGRTVKCGSLHRLREQIARMNQVPRAYEVPHQDIPVPPEASLAPGIQQEVPRNVEVPLAPAGIQINPLVVRKDLLYERFRRMKAPEFEGLTDPIEADNWLIDIQVILDFMGLTEHEKVICASFALKNDARHWWMTVQMRRDVAAMS